MRRHVGDGERVSLAQYFFFQALYFNGERHILLHFAELAELFYFLAAFNLFERAFFSF